VSVGEKRGPTRYCQVAEGKTKFLPGTTSTGSWVCYIIMRKIWFHDKNCTTRKYAEYGNLVQRRGGPNALESNSPYLNTFTTEFDHDGVFKGAFDALIDHINSAYCKPLLANPPGRRITFGHDSKYTFDDRCVEYMPSKNFVEQISYIDYHRALVRFTYTWICANDLCYQFTNEFSSCQYPPLPEPSEGDNYGGMFDLCYSSVIHGGHNIDQTVDENGKRKKIYTAREQAERKIIHQLCHQDIPPVSIEDEEHGGVLLFDASENPATLNSMFSGSLLIPLQNKASIYIKNTSHWRTLYTGEAFYFPGDLPHGGETIRYSGIGEPEWNLRLHLYLISPHHPLDWNDLQYHTTVDSYLPAEHIGLVNPGDLVGVRDHCIETLGIIMDREDELDEFFDAQQEEGIEIRLKRTLSDKRRMSFNVAMHYPVITVYYAAISKH